MKGPYQIRVLSGVKKYFIDTWSGGSTGKRKFSSKEFAEPPYHFPFPLDPSFLSFETGPLRGSEDFVVSKRDGNNSI